jgi:hypothetical protein
MVAFNYEINRKILNINGINLINYQNVMIAISRGRNLRIQEIIKLFKSCLKLSACIFIR